MTTNGRRRVVGALGRLLPLAGALLASASCSGEPAPLPAADGGPFSPRTPVCRDEDGDGFGVGCAQGQDCDDADESVTFECACDEPSSGCPCDEPGRAAPCGRAYASAGSQLVCGQGVTTCVDGSWGECVLVGDISLAQGLQRPQALGMSSDCEENPCDPGCVTFVDTPDGIMVDDTIELASDGITLPGDGSVSTTPVGGGFGCVGGDYPPSSGTCAHHICETGGALQATCDNLPATTTNTTLFADTFSGGNTKGWTLDTSWAIGAAAVSSGHTTGGADPATDATTTSDNYVAGTALGGNIGGGTQLLLDTFANLGNWTETGEGDWNVEALSSSSLYPASASGSLAAHSDDCDTTCTITLTSGVNLLGSTSATLDLLRYVGSSLDSGEYLRLEAFNGVTWSTLANWSSDGGFDDGAWHQETFNLASYLVNGFKVRFVTKQSGGDEHVHVDDVRISVPSASVTRYMTSPEFDASTVNGSVTLSFARWLNMEAPASRAATIDVYNGLAWVNVWTNTAAVSDSAWTTQTFDLTAYKNDAMRVRFGWSGGAASRVSGWNLDDVAVTGSNDSAASSFCVAAVCAEDPTCCTVAWHAGCLARIEAACGVDCSRNTATNACVACYADDTLVVDFDGDGFSPAQGDCLECDPLVNPGAYDFPDNGVDEDCDGSADNAPTSCDDGLSVNGDAWAHARALGLCQEATATSWGLLGAEFVRADGITPCTDSLQRAVMSSFGAGNSPTEGSRMSVFSSGAARASADGGYVPPNGDGYKANTNSTPANAVPAASGCSAGPAGYDSCGVKLLLRAPTNANSFSFNFDFFTSEYPEWRCTAFNDAFVAYYQGSLNTQADKNISFDSGGNPVSVNNGLFTIPGGATPPATGSHPQLNGTGFDGVCANNYDGSQYTANSICGGATGWLSTSAPVAPGEEISLHFSIWDTGDRSWDSTVLLDGFAWSTSTASIETGVYDPGTTAGMPLVEGSFVRDYDLSTSCGDSEKPLWSLWSWSASTPSDSKIEFFVTTAATAAELDSAPEHQLRFSDPPGPSALAGQPAVAQSSSSTQVGSAMVLDTLELNERPTGLGFLRVRSRLVPSTDATTAPTLHSWNLQASCTPAE
jgi:hypothetical protein